jgi:hypothetical protein
MLIALRPSHTSTATLLVGNDVIPNMEPKAIKLADIPASTCTLPRLEVILVMKGSIEHIRNPATNARDLSKIICSCRDISATRSITAFGDNADFIDDQPLDACLAFSMLQSRSGMLSTTIG